MPSRCLFAFAIALMVAPLLLRAERPVARGSGRALRRGREHAVERV
jgi:hypothetical protein